MLWLPLISSLVPSLEALIYDGEHFQAKRCGVFLEEFGPHFGFHLVPFYLGVGRKLSITADRCCAVSRCRQVCPANGHRYRKVFLRGLGRCRLRILRVEPLVVLTELRDSRQPAVRSVALLT
jgi:hypothetical protein